MNMQNVTALIVWNTRNTFNLKSMKKGQILVLTFKTSHRPHGVLPQSKPIFVLPTTLAQPLVLSW